MKWYLPRILEIGRQRAPGSARELKDIVKDYPQDKKGIYIYQFGDYADFIHLLIFASKKILGQS